MQENFLWEMDDLSSKPKSYLGLFIASFQLSAFTFGGGYVIVPLMKKKFVDKLGWLDEKEMLDFIAIAQSSPGALAVNASLLVGYRLFGLGGALLAMLATVLPPLFLISIIAMSYSAVVTNPILRNVLRGMGAGVCAMILDVVIEMASAILKMKHAYPLILMIAAFVAVAIFQVNVVLVIILCALSGLMSTLRRKGDTSPHVDA